jgi:hypothetical protein
LAEDPSAVRAEAGQIICRRSSYAAGGRHRAFLLSLRQRDPNLRCWHRPRPRGPHRRAGRRAPPARAPRNGGGLLATLAGATRGPMVRPLKSGVRSSDATLAELDVSSLLGEQSAIPGAQTCVGRAGRARASGVTLHPTRARSSLFTGLSAIHPDGCPQIGQQLGSTPPRKSMPPPCSLSDEHVTRSRRTVCLLN